ncbi:hypothetical protein PUNSTDRAFT_41143 [Punctularia strigosozonata HHB-11173 SS5]|uniref:uncharacterized protein n=1 Tax=Punctularia strigosozonata (strain HHB-11173) TaxID=741275 RepID=UPI0004418619|nr:uncharacterized protein PUNSTDRAFT_41143 [Punctularia strigosozonata HHB-11173 SS5]EIN13631.1 hypothetical protein PUNSTDRAFT_41143 [Punctularia strigosozonata HHB-11173 SS5]
MPPRLPTQGFHAYVSFYSSAVAPSRAPPKDPYEVLGVKRDATAADIKKTYFSLARKYHPDTNPDKNAREKFQEIQDAYDTLKDDSRRAAYDRYGSASQQPGFNPDAFEQAQNPFSGGFSFSSMFRSGRETGARPDDSDMFETLFGPFGGGHGRRTGYTEVIQGADIEASIGISFQEACKGTSRTIDLTPVNDCPTCTGTGMRKGANRVTCNSCGGTGTRTFVIDNGFQMSSTCTTCLGAGTTIPRGARCGACSGVGKVRVKSTTKVDIPAGVEDGMLIRIRGAGDAPVQGKGVRGDLLVRVSVAPSKEFRRQGANLYYTARIPLHTALLGGRVRVPTLDGDVDVRVPAGTQQAEQMVLKGRGVTPALGGSKGDLLVEFLVQIPRLLTDRQRALIQEYADDVEGRIASTQKTAKKTAEAPSDNTSEAKTSTNGTDFNSPSPSPDEGGRISLWQRLKKLIGF